jgi:glycosyltransferase involved in cell wall biosynthesis
MKPTMLFSICIPARNAEKSISQALQSALNQTFCGEWEVLISENHSTDNTRKILTAAKSDRLRIVSPDTSVGMWGNHNYCLQQAAGRYVVFCHADDELSPDCLTLYSALLATRSYPAKYISWGHSIFRDFEVNISRCGIYVDTPFSGEYSFMPFAFGGLTPSGTLYSRESFLGIGAFLEGAGSIFPSDLISMIRASAAGFEFEMHSRLVLFRRAAGTAIFSRPDIVRAHHFSAFQEYHAKVGDAQMRDYFSKMARISSNNCISDLEAYCIKNKLVSWRDIIRRVLRRRTLASLKALF